jgi:hypothetical protein
MTDFIRPAFPNTMKETSHMDVMLLGKGVKFLLNGFPYFANSRAS